MPTRKLTLCALLSAVALGIFVLEAQLPPLLPIPGIKPGLSNIITLFALVRFGKKEAVLILLVRILLGNLILGQVMALLYALAGGSLSFLCMAAAVRWLPKTQHWVAGVLGGLAHNIGQMLVALAVTQTPELIYYLPILLLFGLVSGTFTGLCAQLLCKHFT